MFKKLLVCVVAVLVIGFALWLGDEPTATKDMSAMGWRP